MCSSDLQRRGADGPHPLSLYGNVSFHQLMQLQQVLHSSQMLAQVLGLQPALQGARGMSMAV